VTRAGDDVERRPRNGVAKPPRHSRREERVVLAPHDGSRSVDVLQTGRKSSRVGRVQLDEVSHERVTPFLAAERADVMRDGMEAALVVRVAAEQPATNHR
jgi:hypothetical protein